MRRIAFILTALTAILASAQTHYEGTIAVGGKGGASFSRVNFNPTVQQVMLPGMTAGVMFRYIEENHFGLIAELNLTQRGWKEKFEESDYKYNHSFTYLELPIMTHIFFGNQRVKGFFNAGPELNVMLGDGVSSNFNYQQAGDMEYFINDAPYRADDDEGQEQAGLWHLCQCRYGSESECQALTIARRPFLLRLDRRLP